MIELDDDEKAVRPPAASAHVDLAVEDHKPPVYKAEAPRFGSVQISSEGEKAVVVNDDDWTSKRKDDEDQL